MTTPQVPESRVYQHSQCGQDTVIAESAFEVASNPLSDMTRTWCSNCNAFFPIAEYRWSDTGESISEYYARYSTRATAMDRFLTSKKFMIMCAALGLGAILGGVGGYFLFRNERLWLQIPMIPFTAGVVAFIACVIYLQLGKAITKRVCGVSDTRLLT